MLAKCVPTILELNGNKRFSCKNTKLNICHHMLTSTTQLQNRSFHVVERTSAKCPKMKNARAKRAKLLFFIVKYANLWRSCCRRRRGCLSFLFEVLTTTRARSSKYFVLCLYIKTIRSCQANRSALRLFCTRWPTWNNRKRLNLTQSSILRSRFSCSCRRSFLTPY